MLDWVDWDMAVPELLDINAVPERWRASMEKVQAIREGRAQARSEQQMVEAAPAMASVVGKMMPSQGASAG